jgi:peptidoglycan hydrolase-like protein with peptidoglycan-binding domain
MADLYLPGAERRQLDDAPMAGDGGSRTIWHITWDRNATAAAPADLLPFDTLARYFASDGAGAAPHLLWDPFTGRTVQYFAATSRSKSVVNAPGGVETNRKGNVCIQIESLFFPYCRVDGRVYPTLRDTPSAGLDKIMAWLRSWGVPDVWPMGEPTWTAHRDATVWSTRSGHYGHSQVPENDHTDPGPMPPLFAAAPTPAPPTPAPPPSTPAPAYATYDGHLIVNFTASDRVRMWQAYMAWRGWTITVDGDYGPKSEAVCRAFQTECNAQGYSVGDVDGKLGARTWAMTKTKPRTR